MTDAEIDAPLTRKGIDKLAPVFASFPNLIGPDRAGENWNKYQFLWSRW